MKYAYGSHPSADLEHGWTARETIWDHESADFPIVSRVQLENDLDGRKIWVEATQCGCESCHAFMSYMDECSEDPMHCAICTNYVKIIALHDRKATAQAEEPITETVQ